MKKPPKTPKPKGIPRVCNMDTPPGPNCDGCSLRSQGYMGLTPDVTLRAAQFVVVGEGPGRDEIEAQEGFVGTSGKVLAKAMDKAELQGIPFAKTNVVLCRPENNRSPTPNEIKNCRPILEAQLAKATNAKVLVAAGGTAAHAVTGLLGPGKRQKGQHSYSGILKWRGYVVKVEDEAGATHRNMPERFVLGVDHGVVGVYKSNGKYGKKGDPKFGNVDVAVERLKFGGGVEYVLPILHPAYVARGFKEMPALVADLHKVRRLLSGEEVAPTPTNVAFTIAEVRRKGWFGGSLGDVDWLAFDIETKQLDPAHGSIVRISFSWRKGQGITLPWNSATKAFTKELLENPSSRKVGHNIVGFDLPHLAANGVYVEGGIYDTLLMGQMLDPDMPKSLNFVLSLYVLAERWKDLSGDDPEWYSLLDSERLMWLIEWLTYRLDREHMWDHFDNVIRPALSTLAEFNRHGMRVDEERLVAWRERLCRQLIRLGQMWQQRNPTVTISSPAQLAALFGTENADKHVVNRLAGERNVDARILKRYRKIEQLLKYVHPKHYHRQPNGDVRVFPKYMPVSKDSDAWEDRVLTATGRRAAKDPPVMQFPKVVRKVFVPDRGMLFWEADYEQIEAWLTAIECRDETMLELLYSGVKIHHWAQERLRRVDERISYRGSKVVVHGTNYMMGWVTLQRSLHNDDIYVDAATTKELIAELKSQLAGRTLWQNAVIEEAAMWGQVVNAFGRKRKFHLNGRGELEEAPAAVAFKPASNMADIMWHNLRDLPKVLEPLGARVLGDNHDSVYGQLRPERLKETVVAIGRTMERTWPEITGEDWKWFCPVEIGVGPSWGETQPVEWYNYAEEVESDG